MEADGVEETLADSPALLRAIERLSRAFAGRGLGSMAETIAAGLADAPPLEAAGVWLDQSGCLVRRAWVNAVGERIDEQAVAAAVAALQGAPRQDLLGQRSLLVLPLLRDDERFGALALVSGRVLSDVELTALSLLARQVAAELAARTLDGGMPGAISEFIALITHELRSPLTALRGNVQLAGMAARKGDLPRASERIEAALKGVDGITTLMQNLQDISQLERGRFELRLDPGELAPIIERAARRAERTTDLDQGVIALSATPSLVAQDAARLEQAFFNLFVNALQYSQGSPVQVRLAVEGGEAVVTIADRGIGIPREELGRIFEPYARGAAAARSHAKGLGLGLTISRATVQRHGGALEVESLPGQGSVFTVRLPLLAVA
ncbi:MAG TPA: HAMP domain-containing sensor histidine kinase [Thermomicrobiaceae bacterium]|nr:HAMP domain-containing sensor histidine kinase [Thermomicrobiaceae bacterium]